MMALPPFREYFRELWGYAPFPWQERLAARVVEEGWPDVADIPTGLGKTATLDIAVWAIAAEADRPPANRRTPTRIWYVVNRRLLVDEGYWRACRIAAMLDDPAGRPAVAAVADRLRRRNPIAQQGGPLHVGRLRGGVDDMTLPVSPAQPAVISSTVPMYGSRLLFRGYGAGRYTRSVETALAVTDSLVLLDESHLAEDLRRLIVQIGEADVATRSVVGEARALPTLVSLSATATDSGSRFSLDETDLAHPLVAKRLNAAKPLRLVPSKRSALVADLAEAVIAELQGRIQPAGAIVFVNSPATAPELSNRIRREAGRAKLDLELLVLTGRMRDVDAAVQVGRLLDKRDGIPNGRDRSALSRHLVVVATQTLEVGADVDADVVVSETAGVRAVIQRFGRLNRSGDAVGPRAVLVHPMDARADGLYGTEPAEVWERLGSCGLDADLDLAPAHIGGVLGAPASVTASASELLPNHLDDYVKTSDRPPGEAPVSLFFESRADTLDRARVAVAWRVLGPPSEGRAVRLLTPISAAESVEVPIAEARRFIEQRGATAFRVDDDQFTATEIAADDLRPGDQLVFATNTGGYRSEVGWSPASTDEVIDVSSHSGVLGLDPQSVRHAVIAHGIEGADADALVLAAAMFQQATIDPTRPATVVDLDADRQAVAQADPRVIEFAERVGELALDGLLAAEVEARWLAGVALASGAFGADATGAAVEVRQAEDGRWFAQLRRGRGRRWAAAADDVFDELSRSAEVTLLGGHLRSVGDTAERLATAIGLPGELVAAVRHAGWIHDLGKADPRFQRWLGAGERLAAKSGAMQRAWDQARAASGWPRGGRHEALSVQLATSGSFPEELLQPDSDLVVHLVASHHGRGRPGLWGVESPTVEVVVNDDDLDSEIPIGVVKVDGQLARHDWDQPGRFHRCNERYGRYGVALLEAVLRQADWLVSAAANLKEERR